MEKHHFPQLKLCVLETGAVVHDHTLRGQETEVGRLQARHGSELWRLSLCLQKQSKVWGDDSAGKVCVT